MLNQNQRNFFIVFSLVGLILSNVILFAAWQESLSNIDIVKSNAIKELYECGCDGYYWEGVPYKEPDFNFVFDKNTKLFVK